MPEVAAMPYLVSENTLVAWGDNVFADYCHVISDPQTATAVSGNAANDEAGYRRTIACDIAPTSIKAVRSAL